MKYFLEHHQSIHPILPCVSLSSCLFITFNCAVQVSKHYNGENETFCVKCGLIADHFSSLVRMRTKSAIADLYLQIFLQWIVYYSNTLKIRSSKVHCKACSGIFLRQPCQQGFILWSPSCIKGVAGDGDHLHDALHQLRAFNASPPFSHWV